MMADTERCPGHRSRTRSAEAFTDEDTTSVEATSTVGAFTYYWEACPDHPWYGVSVMVAGDQAVCVPPLDGTPNHYVETVAL